MTKFTSAYQERLFNRSKELSSRIQNRLGSAVQNDLSHLLDDEHITKEQITIAKKELLSSYERIVKDLIQLKTDMVEYLEHYEK